MRQQGLKFCFACSAPNKASNYASPAARQQGLKFCFTCGAPTRPQITICIYMCAPCGTRTCSGFCIADPFFTSKWGLEFTKSFAFSFACGAPTRLQNLLHLRRADKASNFASPAARQQATRPQICFACGEPTRLQIFLSPAARQQGLKGRALRRAQVERRAVAAKGRELRRA